jgi:uncharacterized secreted protein with C-terminal beta-propeller domain
MKFPKNKWVTISVAILVLISLGSLAYFYFVQKKEENATVLGSFKNCEEIAKAYANGRSKASYPGGLMDNISLSPTTGLGSLASPSESETSSPEYSETNVQVEGVDESDIVKTDGEYIYSVVIDSRSYDASGQDKVIITKAYPKEDSKKVSEIVFTEEEYPHELYVKDDRLTIIGERYENSRKTLFETGYGYPNNYVFAKIYNTSDKEKPELERTVEYEGSYSTSRMIDNNIHLVVTSSSYYYGVDENEDSGEDIIPLFRDFNSSEEDVQPEPACDCLAVKAVNPEFFSSMLSIVSFDVSNENQNVSKEVIAGYSENVYASKEAIYIASTNYNDGDWIGYGSENEETQIFKFELDGAKANYTSSGKVDGTVLNQFSMDEHNGYFRVATTEGHVSREGDSTSKNNVFVLDSELKTVGSVKDLAKGERIYSARFMGDKAYLVTFKKVDPFFTLDMADPKNPKVLGALKIPGYSDYLHPYDENHIIGIGKNTTEEDTEDGDFAWYQGIKIAIFDVTDFANPKELHKVIIGDRGTDSYALDDHKAFLFDKDKNLLVIPVLLAELSDEQREDKNTEANTQGEYTFQGAFVYNISLDKGLELKGKITHMDNQEKLDDNYGYYDEAETVKRALYIDDLLYTISNYRIKANNLETLEEEINIKL